MSDTYRSCIVLYFVVDSCQF